MLFVAGNSRSGTTMMGHVLGRHSRVFMFDELHFFERLWTTEQGSEHLTRESAEALAAKLLCIQRDGILFQGDPQRFAADAAAIVARIPTGPPTGPKVFGAFLLSEAERAGKQIPCDQTPRNLFYIAEILELYPTARVVVLVRDPRDILISQKRKWTMNTRGARRDPLWEIVRVRTNYHPLITTMLWNAAVAAGLRWAEHPRVQLLRFEDLVRDPVAHVSAICECCGIDFQPDMLDVPQVNSSHAGAGGARGIHSEAAGRWRNGGLSRTELYLCELVASANMRAHGYEPSGMMPNWLAVAWSVAVLPAKLALALIFNKEQVKSIPQAVRRRFGRRKS